MVNWIAGHAQLGRGWKVLAPAVNVLCSYILPGWIFLLPSWVVCMPV
jgi:hypothetical protein